MAFKFLKMLKKTNSLKFLLILCLLLGSFKNIDAQEKAQTEQIPQERKDFGNYYFEMPEKAPPVFTQIIRWTDSPGVLRYEVTLKTADGTIIFEKAPSAKNELELNLAPGSYFYKVYVYNMLGALEQESEWIAFTIKQARQPKIDKLTPQRLYLEDENFTIEVDGSGFSPQAKLYFISEDGTKKQVISSFHAENKKITFKLRNPNAFLGDTYFLTVSDPSGLSTKSDKFIVKYRKPVDFYIGAAYTPFSPVSDQWYVENFNKKFYPIGMTGECGLIFLKTHGGFLGTELRVTYRKHDLIAEMTTVKNSSLFLSAHLLYEYWFIRQLAITLKAGGGVTMNFFTTEDKRKVQSIDPAYGAGLGLRVKPVKYLYMDIGVSIDQFINRGTKPLFISPELGIGFRY